MTEPESWPRLQDLYHAALARPASEREAFLAEACGPDQELLGDVRALLGFAEDAKRLLDQPVAAAATERLAALPGARLGPYEILELIASGGMGEVYRARDPRLGRDVAVKVLPGSMTEDPEALARFEREARTIAALSHPHVCALHDVGRHEGTPYLVMELLEGETLARRLKQGPLPLEQALRAAIEIAEALEAAHSRGIVHRDLKPANVLVSPSGHVKVMDFGLARVARTETREGDAAARSELGTRDGVILGTAPYMSPEQARGQAADARTDVWAFGCVLYEALTGRRAFGGATASDTLAAVLDHDVDWEALPGATPPAVRALLRRCLQKDRERRLHDVADARLELEDALEAPPGSPPVRPGTEGAPVSARRPSPYAWMALSAALALALGAALLRDAPGDPTATRVTRTLVPLATAPRGPSYDLRLAISPDGSAIAYSDVELYILRLDELEARLIEGTAPATSPFFSPDGRWVGFVTRSTGKKVPVTGGAPVALWARGGGGHGGASWSPSGTIVFGSRGTIGGLRQLRPGEATPEVLSEPDLARGHFVHRWPQILPGEDAVLLTVGRAEMESWDEASIAVLRRSTGELRIVLEGGSQAAYSATGHLVYLRGSSLLAVPFDLSDLRVRGTPVPVIEGVNWEAGFGLSEDGTLVYAPGAASRPRSRMLLVDRGGTELRLLAEGAEYHNTRFSPDGGRVAFMSGVTPDIRVLDLARGTETAITSGWINGWPIWAPDGRYVQFQSMRSGEWNSHRRLADGSGDVEHLLATPDHLSRRVGEAAGVALWVETPGPDSSSGSSDLMLRSPETGAPLRPFLATPAHEAGAELSPDRQWVAYHSDESGRFEVYLRPFPEGAAQWLVSTGGGRYPRWSRGGREIVYLDGDRVMAVDVRVAEGTPELGRPRRLFERPIAWKWGYPAYDVAPDGQSFVIAEPGEATPTAGHLVLVQNFGVELKRRVAGAVSR